MPRSPEEVYAEIAAWPLEERLRLAAMILEAGAAQIEALKARAARSASPAPSPPGDAKRAALPATPAAGLSSQKPGAHPHRPTAGPPAPRAAGASSPQAGATSTPRSGVIVDGSNFLGTVSGYNLATDESRDELILRLQDFAREHPALRVVVYFDGQKTTVTRAGGVEVRFTSGQKPADFFILEALRALGESDRHHALLITADRALGDAARKLGAKVEAPSSFHRRLPALKRTSVGERGLSAAEVQAWEEYFQAPPAPGKGPRQR